jgi:hypothetical protein
MTDTARKKPHKKFTMNAIRREAQECKSLGQFSYRFDFRKCADAVKFIRFHEVECAFPLIETTDPQELDALIISREEKVAKKQAQFDLMPENGAKTTLGIWLETERREIEEMRNFYRSLTIPSEVM